MRPHSTTLLCCYWDALVWIISSVRAPARVEKSSRRADGKPTHEDAGRVFHSYCPGRRDRVGTAPEIWLLGDRPDLRHDRRSCLCPGHHQARRPALLISLYRLRGDVPRRLRGTRADSSGKEVHPLDALPRSCKTRGRLPALWHRVGAHGRANRRRGPQSVAGAFASRFRIDAVLTVPVLLVIGPHLGPLLRGRIGLGAPVGPRLAFCCSDLPIRRCAHTVLE
jgi:hypothetical protein